MSFWEILSLSFWLFELAIATQRKAWNTPGLLLAVWSVWGDSDEVDSKSVRCVQLHWKLLEPCGQHLLRFNMRSLRRLAIGRQGHWILWLAVCSLYDHSDWLCASESVQCVGGVEFCVCFVFLCTLFHHVLFSFSLLEYWHETSTTRC